MTYAQFVARMNEFRANVAPLPPTITSKSASLVTGLRVDHARRFLDRMTQEQKAVREQPRRKVFYTIGGAA